LDDLEKERRMSSGTEPISNDEIRLVVERLSRPHPSGGRVIERAGVLAEGARSGAILEWLGDHEWMPEEDAPPVAGRDRGSGLYGARRDGGRAGSRAPRRYVSPPA
jgi:hypothetical protein